MDLGLWSLHRTSQSHHGNPWLGNYYSPSAPRSPLLWDIRREVFLLPDRWVSVHSGWQRTSQAARRGWPKAINNTVIAPVRGRSKTSHYGRATRSRGSSNPYPIISLYDKLPAYQIPTPRSNYSLWHTKRPIVRLWLKVIANSHWTNEKCTVQGSAVTDCLIRIISRF